MVNNGRSLEVLRYAFFFTSGILAGALFTFFYLSLPHERIPSRFEWLNSKLPNLRSYVQGYDGGFQPTTDKVANHGTEELPHIGSRAVADVISSKVKVFCWILTSKENHATRAVHVNNTWLRHCNGYIFGSSSANESLGAVDLGVPEGREYLWQKTQKAFTFIYHNYLDEYDWFLKADDDTYVIVENLRLLLLSYDPEKPIYFGCNFAKNITSYMSGGAGYVLSRAAVKAVVENHFQQEEFSSDSGPEDVNMGYAAETSGVETGVSYDAYGRPRFFPINPEFHMFKRDRTNYWLWEYSRFPMNLGLNCCSDFTITFHYVKPSAMYVLEFLVYHLTPFGVFNGPFAQLLSLNESDIWRISTEFADKFNHSPFQIGPVDS